MTRKHQLWALILTSALTAFFQYIIQGSLATGANPLEFDPRFWIADRIFWGIRSLIESWVVVYLFTTRAKTWYQEVLLALLEIALLALIAYTLGPAFQALGAGTTVYELLGSQSYGNWAYAIGAYTSLMMAGAGIAYKIQPFDVKEEAAEEKIIAVKEEPRPRSEYSEWSSRDERHRQIVRFVQENDSERRGLDREVVFAAVWNGKEGSTSTKYGDITDLVKSGELVELEGNGRKIAFALKDMSAF